MSKPFIKFGILPGHWGLKGKTRDIAKAEYELTGIDLKLRLAEINSESIMEYIKAKNKILFENKLISEYEHDINEIDYIDCTDTDKDRLKLDVNFKHGKISEYEYKKAIVSYMPEGDEKLIAEVEVEHQYGKIDQNTYEKRIADIKKERWICPKIDVNRENPSYGSIDIECNDYFIEFLRDNGYVAPSKEQVLDLWLHDICKSVALSGMLNEEEIEELTDRKVRKIKKK